MKRKPFQEHVMRETCLLCKEDFKLSTDSFLGQMDDEGIECTPFTQLIALCPECYKLYRSFDEEPQEEEDERDEDTNPLYELVQEDSQV